MSNFLLLLILCVLLDKPIHFNLRSTLVKIIIALVFITLLLVCVAVSDSGTGPISLEDQNMTIVQLSFYAYNEGDLSSFADLHSPDYIQHAPDFKDPITWPEYELACRIAHNRLPQLKYRIEEIFAVKDKVAVRAVWECPMDSYEFKFTFPDGIVKGQHISITRIKNGKIIEEWYEYDTVGIQRLIRSVKRMDHIK